jgi:hypothetical protein
MKVFWNYQCDYGHHWELLKEEHAEESPEETVCPYGHEAVTLQKAVPVDEVVISFLPAGVILDPVMRRLSTYGKYWFVLINRVGGDEEKKSSKSYNWLEVTSLANKFHGLTWDKARQLWKRLEP